MHGSAVILMLTAMAIIWGGLIVASLTLRNHSRSEESGSPSED